MRSYKRILLILIIVFIGLQFIPSVRNQSGQMAISDISRIYNVPKNVHAVLVKSCYDCHSNNTNYPWYANVQPFRYWLDHHVEESKKELNFNEYGTYSKRRQANKLRAIGSSITDDTMPLSSYILIHRKAKLNDNEKLQVLKWVEDTRDSLSTSR